MGQNKEAFKIKDLEVNHEYNIQYNINADHKFNACYKSVTKNYYLENQYES